MNTRPDTILQLRVDSVTPKPNRLSVALGPFGDDRQKCEIGHTDTAYQNLVDLPDGPEDVTVTMRVTGPLGFVGIPGIVVIGSLAFRGIGTECITARTDATGRVTFTLPHAKLHSEGMGWAVVNAKAKTPFGDVPLGVTPDKPVPVLLRPWNGWWPGTA